MRLRSTSPWSLIAVSAAFVVGTIAAALLLLLNEHEARYNALLTEHLRTYVRVLQQRTTAAWPDLDPVRTSDILDALRAEGVTAGLVTKRGAVHLADGRPLPGLVWNSPEVQQAYREAIGTDKRPWPTVTDRAHLVVAMRLRPGTAEPDAVWVARPAWSVADAELGLGRRLSVAALIAAVLTAGLAYTMWRVRRRMLVRLLRATRQLSRGDVQTVVEAEGGDDFALLAHALNALRRRMSGQLDTIDRQRRMLAALVEQLDEGVVVARRTGRIVLMNPAAVRLLNTPVDGRGPAGLVGKPIETCIPQHQLQQLLLAPPEPAPAADALQPQRGRALTLEHPGRTVHLLAHASRIDLGEGDGPDSAGVALVLTDVTELQRTVQLRTDFVANASHELRTPLSTIRAAVETLLTMDLALEAEPAQGFLNVIDRHSARLEAMVRDLLDLSRVEASNRAFEPETLSLRMVLDDMRTRFREALERQDVTLEIEALPDEAATLEVNPNLLRLALDNLLDNAIKFSPPHRAVWLRIERTADRARFEVADHGPGIPPADLERVFERFYQVEQSRSGPLRGTGLGLSIVRHAVGAMRGAVKLDSAPGRGTTAVITIPQSQRAARMPPSDATAARLDS